MMPVFPIKTLLLLIIPVSVAAVILAVAGKRGGGVFKKQGVAWGLTVVMVFAAIGIGYAKAPMAGTREPAPAPDYGDSYHWEGGQFLLDNADVLSDRTLRELDQRNERLWNTYSVTIGVVTCDNERDLGDYALACAEKMGLGGYDFLVALDIAGENYWLVQGDDIRRVFTDDDCSDYAYDCMEKHFAAGDYDNAVLKLTKALEDWYGNYYG